MQRFLAFALPLAWAEVGFAGTMSGGHVIKFGNIWKFGQSFGVIFHELLQIIRSTGLFIVDQVLESAFCHALLRTTSQ